VTRLHLRNRISRPLQSGAAGAARRIIRQLLLWGWRPVRRWERRPPVVARPPNFARGRQTLATAGRAGGGDGWARERPDKVSRTTFGTRNEQQGRGRFFLMRAGRARGNVGVADALAASRHVQAAQRGAFGLAHLGLPETAATSPRRAPAHIYCENYPLAHATTPPRPVPPSVLVGRAAAHRAARAGAWRGRRRAPGTSVWQPRAFVGRQRGGPPTNAPAAVSRRGLLRHARASRRGRAAVGGRRRRACPTASADVAVASPAAAAVGRLGPAGAGRHPMTRPA